LAQIPALNAGIPFPQALRPPRELKSEANFWRESEFSIPIPTAKFPIFEYPLSCFHLLSLVSSIPSEQVFIFQFFVLKVMNSSVEEMKMKFDFDRFKQSSMWDHAGIVRSHGFNFDDTIVVSTALSSS
jgi:hypothetical protein